MESYRITIYRFTFLRDGKTGVEFSIQAICGDGKLASHDIREHDLDSALARAAWLADGMEREVREAAAR